MNSCMLPYHPAYRTDWSMQPQWAFVSALAWACILPDIHVKSPNSRSIFANVIHASRAMGYIPPAIRNLHDSDPRTPACGSSQLCIGGFTTARTTPGPIEVSSRNLHRITRHISKQISYTHRKLTKFAICDLQPPISLLHRVGLDGRMAQVRGIARL